MHGAHHRARHQVIAIDPVHAERRGHDQERLAAVVAHVHVACIGQRGIGRLQTAQRHAREPVPVRVDLPRLALIVDAVAHQVVAHGQVVDHLGRPPVDGHRVIARPGQRADPLVHHALAPHNGHAARCGVLGHVHGPLPVGRRVARVQEMPLVLGPRAPVRAPAFSSHAVHQLTAGREHLQLHRVAQVGHVQVAVCVHVDPERGAEPAAHHRRTHAHARVDLDDLAATGHVHHAPPVDRQSLWSRDTVDARHLLARGRVVHRDPVLQVQADVQPALVRGDRAPVAQVVHRGRTQPAPGLGELARQRPDASTGRHACGDDGPVGDQLVALVRAPDRHDPGAVAVVVCIVARVLAQAQERAAELLVARHPAQQEEHVLTVGRHVDALAPVPVLVLLPLDEVAGRPVGLHLDQRPLPFLLEPDEVQHAVAVHVRADHVAPQRAPRPLAVGGGPGRLAGRARGQQVARTDVGRHAPQRVRPRCGRLTPVVGAVPRDFVLAGRALLARLEHAHQAPLGVVDAQADPTGTAHLVGDLTPPLAGPRRDQTQRHNHGHRARQPVHGSPSIVSVCRRPS